MMSVAYPPVVLEIGDTRIGPQDRKSGMVIDPATGTAIGRYPILETADVDLALASATAAFDPWRRRPAYERGRILKEAAEILRQRIADLAPVLTLEQGKPLAEAKGEIGLAADILEWCGEEAERVYGRTVPARVAEVEQIVQRRPVGPVAAFTPWNYPAQTAARKIGSALAAECVMLLKPAEETPATVVALAQALRDAGLPPGVLTILLGVPNVISERLIRSPVVRKISLTGSVAVGLRLAALAADVAKPCLLELGGHAPAIVCADGDPVKAAKLLAVAKFRNAGQICVSPTRFYVHEQHRRPFCTAMIDYVSRLTLGPGMEESTTLGPLANARRLDHALDLVADARRLGATVLWGGERHGASGYFMKPTVLTDVPENARILQEEPFAPIVPILTYSDLDAAIESANGTPFALAAYAFTDSATLQRRLADRLDCGILCINHTRTSTPATPFGGSRLSGYGREGGPEGLDGYLTTKLVSVAKA